MREKLRIHVEGLFSNAPNTRKVQELKEELLSDLTAKFDDLVAQGCSEEEAFKIAIAGIGDVDELFKGLENDKIYNYARRDTERKKSASILSVAIGLYILSIAVVLIFESTPYDSFGPVAMFIIDAVATGLIIYNVMSRPRYHKYDNTFVEDYKERRYSRDGRRQVERSITSCIWALIVAFYFIVSFLFGSWAYSWVIFIIGAAVHNIVHVIFISSKE